MVKLKLFVAILTNHVHINKTLNKELKEKILQETDLARRIDNNFVGCVKKRNYIRRSKNLCIEKQMKERFSI